jgi:hypothetical protein
MLLQLLLLLYLPSTVHTQQLLLHTYQQALQLLRLFPVLLPHLPALLPLLLLLLLVLLLLCNQACAIRTAQHPQWAHWCSKPISSINSSGCSSDGHLQVT